MAFFLSFGVLACILCWDNLNPYSEWRCLGLATGATLRISDLKQEQ
jgi:hypothetical protein